MSYARQLLGSHQGTVNVDVAVLAAAIDAISDCAQACIADTDADLGEQDVTEMARCIRLCLDCTDVCAATAGHATGSTGADHDLRALFAEPEAADRSPRRLPP
jgi:hypothetical protein